jgi:2-polyprenyl-3-methyl-5-hydroxy-6-metoxy-1,4-benzoquinol methylase
MSLLTQTPPQPPAKTVKCKVCGTEAYHLCDTPNEHGDIRTIQNYRCGNCGLVFVGTPITNDQLGAAYASMDSAKYYEEVGKTTERKFQTALTNLRRLTVNERSSLIDIGAGRGDFLLFLKRAGFQCLSGQEIPGEDTRELEDNGITVYKDYDYHSIPSESFDVVTSLDVMEHVPDPRKVAQSLYRILKPRGIMYFHTPCVTFTDRLMHRVQKVPGVGKVGRIWQRGRTSIFHLQNYTRNSLELILREAGFDSVSITGVNELSWPVRRYVRIFLCEKQGLPGFLSYLVTPLAYPFLATTLLNANKAIVVARKAQ